MPTIDTPAKSALASSPEAIRSALRVARTFAKLWRQVPADEFESVAYLAVALAAASFPDDGSVSSHRWISSVCRRQCQEFVRTWNRCVCLVAGKRCRVATIQSLSDAVAATQVADDPADAPHWRVDYEDLVEVLAGRMDPWSRNAFLVQYTQAAAQRRRAGQLPSGRNGGLSIDTRRKTFQREVRKARLIPIRSRMVA